MNNRSKTSEGKPPKLGKEKNQQTQEKRAAEKLKERMARRTNNSRRPFVQNQGQEGPEDIAKMEQVALLPTYAPQRVAGKRTPSKSTKGKTGEREWPPANRRGWGMGK